MSVGALGYIGGVFLISDRHWSATVEVERVQVQLLVRNVRRLPVDRVEADMRNEQVFWPVQRLVRPLTP